MRRLGWLFLVLVLLAGSPGWLGQAAEKEITVTVYFGPQARPTVEKQMAFAAGTSAMDATRRAFRVETNAEGTFVVSIEGVGNSAERKEYWLYFVNGEAQHVGAAERKLAAGDRVLWFLRRTSSSTHKE